MHCNCVPFLKIYLFIYRADMFRLLPSHLQGAYYMIQQNIVYIFQDIVIYISVLQFEFTVC